MFKNPSLNNIFSNEFDGFYIYSKYSEIEIILRQIANLLSENKLVLYIANSDISSLNANIYYMNIFNKLALKKLKKLKNIDYIIVENITFLDDLLNLPKKSKLISCGFSKYDLRHFKTLNTRILRFYYNDLFFAFRGISCEFKYNFKAITKTNLFNPNKIDFDLDSEIDFYLNCLEQGFKFYDFRNSRKDEIFNAFSYGNIYINGNKMIKKYSKKYFLLNDKKVNCDFIPNGKVFYKAKITLKNHKIIKPKSLFSRLFSFISLKFHQLF